MTQNATAYFNVVETGRANRAQEIEAHRKNVENERHLASSLAETIRHNKAMESQQLQQILESARHNAETEGISWANLNLDWSKLGETSRANRAQEAELFRSHRIAETEAMRHNKATELAGYVSSAGQLLRGGANVSQAATARKRLGIERESNRIRRDELKQRQYRDKHDVMTNWFRVGNDTARNVIQGVQGMTQTFLGNGAKLLFTGGF